MLSRRQILSGATATAVAAVAGRSVPAFATASQPVTPVDFPVPPNACDCHAHVFGDPRRFPFVASRAYTPETASIEELGALHRALHTTRVVIVQPSVYGSDNACIVDTISRLGPIARGIAVINDATTPAMLDQLSGAGIRGIRLNLATAGQTDVAVARRAFAAVADRVASRRWHIQMNTQLSVIEGLVDVVRTSPVPVVFDHFAGTEARLGVRQPGFDVLVDLVHSGHAYVKISAPYRSSSVSPPYTDVSPLAMALIGANVQRVLWGSDWPHPNRPGAARSADGTNPFYQVDDGLIFNQLARWEPDAGRRRTILVENPERLYGFDAR